MKGMLHIYNDCTIDWHQVCANIESGLGWVAHTKYHPSYIKYAWKQSFSWRCPGSEIKSRSKWKVCCTSTMIVQLIGTKYVKICEVVWAESRTQKYHPSYIKYAGKQSFLWPCPGSEIKSRSKWKVIMLHIYNDCTTDWHQVCANMWSGLGWVAHTKYHPSYIKYAEKLSFLWPFPESEMRSRSKWKVCCTSTMIVQLIGIKCVQICEAVWAESRTQNNTPIRNGHTDRRTDGRTDMNPMSPVRGDKNSNTFNPECDNATSWRPIFHHVWHIIKLLPKNWCQI